MAVKTMINDAYITADSAISETDITKLDSIIDENEKRNAAIAICTRLDISYETTDSTAEIISAITDSDKLCKIDEEGYVSI